MSFIQIALLAFVQGAAELLPVSSSAHVIVAEKLMGLDPSKPELTFLLVMLHTGTMFAVIVYFWPRWKKLSFDFVKKAILATAVTGVVGLSLKKLIEKVIFGVLLGQEGAEVEHLFKNLPLIAFSLFSVGLLIIWAGVRERNEGQGTSSELTITSRSSLWIGLVQGLCLPFRGFSRSGATISTSLLMGISRARSEDFSFALAVLLTPPVIVLQLHRLLKSTGVPALHETGQWVQLIQPGILGMGLSFISGLVALKWLSHLLETHRWKYFGVYCIFASGVVLTLHYVLA